MSSGEASSFEIRLELSDLWGGYDLGKRYMEDNITEDESKRRCFETNAIRHLFWS
ncbi:MAG: hypothetical protein ABIK84_06220 [candidate division WOR-3 bacterium]